MEIFLIIFIGACVWAASTDFLYYRIPNWTVLLILIVYTLRAAVLLYTGTELNYFYTPLLSLGITFLIGFILFTLRILGAGDAKLLAVCSLWMGEINPYQFIFLTVISGGILAIIYLKFNQGVDFFRNLLLAKIVDKYGAINVPKTKNAVPYAIAILGGAIWALALNGWQI